MPFPLNTQVEVRNRGEVWYGQVVEFANDAYRVRVGGTDLIVPVPEGQVKLHPAIALARVQRDMKAAWNRRRLYIEKLVAIGSECGVKQKTLFNQALYIQTTVTVDDTHAGHGLCHGIALGYILASITKQSDKFMIALQKHMAGLETDVGVSLQALRTNYQEGQSEGYRKLYLHEIDRDAKGEKVIAEKSSTASACGTAIGHRLKHCTEGHFFIITSPNHATVIGKDKAGFVFFDPNAGEFRFGMMDGSKAKKFLEKLLVLDAFWTGYRFREGYEIQEFHK